MQETANPKMSNYHELPPPPELASYLTCVWIRQTGGEGEDLRPRILPDGCIDIVWVGEDAPKIAGPATHPVIARLPPRTSIVGARFHPGMASSLLGHPAHELLNMDVMLRDVWGATAESALGASAGASIESRLAALRALLVTRVPHARPGDDAIQQAVALLTHVPTIQVQELSQRLDISPRQLLRRFASAVGYGPKTFGRILRFQHALQLARQQGHVGVDLAMLAFTTGYADQAHMAREFSRLAGVPPSTLLSASRNSAEMSDSFKPLANVER